MDLPSDYIEHLRVVQYCLDINTCYRPTFESIGEYILDQSEQSVSVKAVSIINFGLGGGGSLIFRRKLVTVWHISV